MFKGWIVTYQSGHDFGVAFVKAPVGDPNAIARIIKKQQKLSIHPLILSQAMITDEQEYVDCYADQANRDPQIHDPIYERLDATEGIIQDFISFMEEVSKKCICEKVGHNPHHPGCPANDALEYMSNIYGKRVEGARRDSHGISRYKRKDKK